MTNTASNQAKIKLTQAQEKSLLEVQQGKVKEIKSRNELLLHKQGFIKIEGNKVTLADKGKDHLNKKIAEEKKTQKRNYVQLFEHKNIAHNKIKPNPKNGRIYYDQSELMELAGSIHQYGLLSISSLLVYDNEDGTYTIHSGHRRWISSGYAFNADHISNIPSYLSTDYDKVPKSDIEIPCQIISREHKDAGILTQVTNLRQVELHPLDKGFAYKDHIDSTYYDQAKRIIRDLSIHARNQELFKLGVKDCDIQRDDSPKAIYNLACEILQAKLNFTRITQVTDYLALTEIDPIYHNDVRNGLININVFKQAGKLLQDKAMSEDIKTEYQAKLFDSAIRVKKGKHGTVTREAKAHTVTQAQQLADKIYQEISNRELLGDVKADEKQKREPRINSGENEIDRLIENIAGYSAAILQLKTEVNNNNTFVDISPDQAQRLHIHFIKARKYITELNSSLLKTCREKNHDIKISK